MKVDLSKQEIKDLKDFWTFVTDPRKAVVPNLWNNHTEYAILKERGEKVLNKLLEQSKVK